MYNFRKFFFIAILIGIIGHVLTEDLNSEEGLNLLYQKINRLEDEIAELRGKLEETSYLLNRFEELNQQRYVDIDRRLYELTQISPGQAEELSFTDAEQNITEEDYKELSLHRKALELFDLGRFAEALEAFDIQIIKYPKGRYSGDAYFWSGELFLAQENLANAKESYLVLINNYKDHPRYPDSLYKLGEISRISSEIIEANTYYNQVIENYPNTASSLLALKSKESLEEVSK
ncbi:MAG: tol-pal system protein YbgF [SAR86 cluster bacterium]|nr:tol-pal system protein YbgF [SAR86 cluster bacterium]